MNSILYLAEVGYQNAGDEVMWDVFKRQANYHFNSGTYKLTGAPASKATKASFNTIVLGGGSLIAPSYISKLYEGLLHNKPIFIWGSGVDRMINKKGLKYILGDKSAYLSRPPIEVINKLVKSFDNASFTGVRGPLTYSFLQKLGVNMANVTISGDPAFILKPEDAKPFPINDEFLIGNKVVGINWGTTKNKIFGENEAFVEEQLVLVAKNLIQRGYFIILYVMSPEDLIVSQRLLRKIGNQKNVKLVKTINPYEIMDIISKCHFTINMRLHANILSAVMKIPFIALGYRFKVFDFAASINSLPFVIATDCPTINQNIMKLSELIEADHRKIVNMIDNNLQRYQDILTKSFFQKLGSEVNRLE